MPLSLILLLIISTLLPSISLSYDEVSFLIDCGGSANFTDEFNRKWTSDAFYSGGSPGLVAEPHVFEQKQERSLRFFSPMSYGKKNCYSIPVPSGRYYIRLFTVYDNYDSKRRTPSFDVSVESTLVFSWQSPWPDAASRSGAYFDLFVFVDDGEADVCFYSIATDAPVVGAIEVIGVDPLSYDSSTTGHELILVNYGRLTCGSNPFGPGFTNDTDRFGRVWQSDSTLRSKSSTSTVKSLSTLRPILGTDLAPNHFPVHLYQNAITTTELNMSLDYEFPVDTRLDYMLWFHFAEIDPEVKHSGKRVFDIYIDGKKTSRIDIFKEIGNFSAFKWQYVVANISSTPLSIRIVPVVGKPLISGIENYAMVLLDPPTISNQAEAMRALKKSLRVPDRMGWNGDPCSPSSWDAWEGVTCHRNENGLGLVLTQLDLGSQGLKGYISDEIGMLTNLVSVNFSSNSLQGNLPSGLGQKSLETLDLSGNHFNGNIPESLGSASLHLLLLNNNELRGQVPQMVYSIGVHGGEIDLTGNKGLCGVPSLPDCSFLWDKGKLSKGGKIAVALSSVFILLVIFLPIYLFCRRRSRNDYDFAFSQDLSSIAAKRNRYHRQKSLMLLEMETQNTNGFQSPMNPL